MDTCSQIIMLDYRLLGQYVNIIIYNPLTLVQARGDTYSETMLSSQTYWVDNIHARTKQYLMSNQLSKNVSLVACSTGWAWESSTGRSQRYPRGQLGNEIILYCKTITFFGCTKELIIK